jgi:hypothetical protein
LSRLQEGGRLLIAVAVDLDDVAERIGAVGGGIGLTGNLAPDLAAPAPCSAIRAARPSISLSVTQMWKNPVCQ